MSTREILLELPKLSSDERRQLFDCLCDLQERDLLAGETPSAEEIALLDLELEEYARNPNAGSPLQEVMARVKNDAAF